MNNLLTGVSLPLYATASGKRGGSSGGEYRKTDRQTSFWAKKPQMNPLLTDGGRLDQPVSETEHENLYLAVK